MDRASSRPFANLFSLRRLAAGLWVSGLPVFGLGCAEPHLPLVRAASQPTLTLVRAAGDDAETLKAPTPVATQEPKVLPISLDTVFGLAEEQNVQVALARERVQEAFAAKDVADSAWLPDIYAGIAYYRHEGGIQNEDGTLTHSSFGSLFPGVEIHGRLDLRAATFQRVNAERKVWQQKGELSRITSETLLDAANTYIDLLTARTGEAVAREQEKNQRALLKRAQDLAKVEPGARLQVEAIEAEVNGHQQAILKLRQQGDAASSKLAYLLGLGPCTELVPVDGKLVAIALVDATPPTCDLVARALTDGPGIRELEGLLAVIQDALDKAQGPSKYLPVFEVRMAEGAFGAGVGASLDFDNRWDLGLQARWNLTEVFTARDRQRVAQSKLQQVHLTYQDLRGKLTAGVQEAREAILSGQEQIRLNETQVRHANESYRLSDERLKESVQGSSIKEVMDTIRGVETAQLGYLTSLSAYDKAQLRLMVLLGNGAAGGCKLGAPVAHPAAGQLPNLDQKGK